MESNGSQPLPSEKFNKIPQGCGLNHREGLRQAGEAGPERIWEEAVGEGEGEKKGGRDPQTPGRRALTQKEQVTENGNYNRLPSGSAFPERPSTNQSVLVARSSHSEFKKA